MKTLDSKQIADAQKTIDKMPPGEYELKEIYGARWPIGSPTAFGKAFKATVQAGLLRNIKLRGVPKTNNHHTYLVA